MTALHTLFSRIGLSDKEAETFLRLLELGAQPISVLAKHVGLPRSSMYTTVESLRTMKLIQEFEKNGIKYVKCIPVETIADVLRNREREIEHTITLLHEKTPELLEIESTLSVTPKVKFYEGKEEVMQMYATVMKEKSFCAIFDPTSVKAMMPEYHYDLPKMLEQSGGRARELLVFGPAADEYKRLFYSDTHPIKILPKDMEFQSDIIICSDRICMTAYGEKAVSAVEIFSPSLVRAQQVIFDRLWDSA